MIINVYKSQLELVLKSAQDDYDAIVQAMDEKEMSDPNSKMELEKLRFLVLNLEIAFSSLRSEMGYIGGIEELESKIRLHSMLLRNRIDNYEKLSEEKFLYDRLSVCPNGHCYKHIKERCPFCGHSAFVDTIYSNAEVFKKSLYIRQSGSDYILTGDEYVENKVEEIEVGFNPNYKCQGLSISYKFWYKIGNENLNIDIYETIPTGDLSIKAGELIKMCDKIIDGRESEIILTISNFTSNCLR